MSDRMSGRKALEIVERALFVHCARDEEDAFLMRSVRRENGALFIYFKDGSRFRVSVSRKESQT